MALTERRRALIELEKGGVAAAVATYETITDQLTIQPTDTQEDVVKKARSLRELGRLDEAVAAFARYGEMFSADPTSAQYAQVAQAFTRQIGELGVGGGVYIYGIAEGSVAQAAGLEVGDMSGPGVNSPKRPESNSPSCCRSVGLLAQSAQL